jgi:hypothetical protein
MRLTASRFWVDPIHRMLGLWASYEPNQRGHSSPAGRDVLVNSGGAGVRLGGLMRLPF